jgi:hypothetical protein
MATKKEVAVKEDEAQALALYEEVGATGFEETNADDYALPFIKLLQKMSPEVDDDRGEYIAGAKAGMFLDTATQEVFETFRFIPCHYHRAIVEWASPEPNSGYIGQHEPGYEEGFDRYIKDGRDTGKWITPEGHILQDTRYFFGLKRDGEALSMCVLSMTSTQIKKARQWMNKLQSLKFKAANGSMKLYPIFAHTWEFSSVVETKDENSWRGYKVTLVEKNTDASLVKAAIEAREVFVGAAKEIKPVAEAGEPAEAGSRESAEEVPF